MLKKGDGKKRGEKKINEERPEIITEKEIKEQQIKREGKIRECE